jgi:hypothetical protein
MKKIKFILLGLAFAVSFASCVVAARPYGTRWIPGHWAPGYEHSRWVAGHYGY